MTPTISSKVLPATTSLPYSATVYSVDWEEVSHWEQTGENYFDYETTDYFTGFIHRNLSRTDAETLAIKLAQAYAYNIIITNEG